MKGSLKRTPFAQLLREIAALQATGSLYLLEGEAKKVVFFEHGRPLFVRSNVLSECLGQFLAREGLITQDQCDRTLETIRRTGKKQGELLVEMGLLSEGNLAYALVAQVRHKLFDIFGWADGRYQFKPGPLPAGQGISPALPVSAVIVAGMVEHLTHDAALERLTPHMHLFPRLIGDIATLGEEVASVDLDRLASLDGSNSIQELLDESSESAGPPSFAALLVAAFEAELIEFASSRAPATAIEPSAHERARARGDEELIPAHEPSHFCRDFEDTPIPGKLPERPSVLGAEDDAMFADVDGADRPASQPEAAAVTEGTASRARVPGLEDLVAAETDDIDETFENDEVEFLEEAESLDADDHGLAAPHDEDEDEDEGAAALAEPALSNDAVTALADPDAEIDDDLALDVPADLLSGDELDDLALEPGLEGGDLGDLGDDVDLSLPEAADEGGDLDGAPLGAEADGGALDEDEDLDELDELDEVEEADAAEVDSDDPEMKAAMHYARAEIAFSQADWATCAQELEAAYEVGLDVPELHGMLAYARYRGAEDGAEMVDHALELLDYAEGLDPALAVLHSYRAAILFEQHRMHEAEAALAEALRLDPYEELALQVRDGRTS